MNIHDQADLIIVTVAYAVTAVTLLRGILIIAEGVAGVAARRRREKLHKMWVAARRAAREAAEAKMRREGYWDNYEIQDAMKAAGEAVSPGYRV